MKAMRAAAVCMTMAVMMGAMLFGSALDVRAAEQPVTAVITVEAAAAQESESLTTTSDEDMIEYGYMAYSDLVEYIVHGYMYGFDCEPAEMGLSDVYTQRSDKLGFAMTDVNGDGLDELVMGENIGNDTFRVYDMFRVNTANGEILPMLKDGQQVTLKNVKPETFASYANAAQA